MNPFLTNELAGEHIRDIHEEARRARRGRSEERSPRGKRPSGVSIRRFSERDIDAIRRLAALDEKPVPVGGVLVAEREGELVAALPLDGSPALADPFKPTADVVALLAMRARQLQKATETRRSPFVLRRYRFS